MSPVPVAQARNIRPAVADKIISGFHAIEERLRSLHQQAVASKSAASKSSVSMELLYASPGPRVKKILAQARKAEITCTQVEKQQLDVLAATLPEAARDHRGLLLRVTGEESEPENLVDFSQWIAVNREKSLVLLLDSITDPHNVGAILRSCDQFGVNLVVMPERRSLRAPLENEVVARASAGASAWVPVSVVPNLVRVVEQLKDAGFWVYGADAGGTSATQMRFPEKMALIMGSEGAGISRLLEEHCDVVVSIPTCGRLDSLNVSVATGVLLYEVRRQLPR
ncbi:MAG: 23S rRNA (guanosine(2251)-2'-O)-methyltransferase RlmB [Spirochaetaceae bacterium]|nr:23S rRNA (guanosine(2251)-2'-O)-methyltransferase RlmB [Spirochaetaceae bacterium]